MKNVSQNSGRPNRQSERTKSWIFEALMLLMNEKPYAKISISDITRKAGIARTTFYRNYKDKVDIVYEHLNNTISMRLQNIEKDNVNEKKKTIFITFDHKYLLEHKKSLQKIISNTDIENRIFRNMERFPIAIMEHLKKQFSTEEYLICRFKMCYQLTGSIRTIFDWFINNMPIPVEKLFVMINTTNNPRPVKYRNFPNIIFQLKEAK